MVCTLLAPTRAIPLLVEDLCHGGSPLQPDLGLHAALAVILVHVNLVARGQLGGRVVVDQLLLRAPLGPLLGLP